MAKWQRFNYQPGTPLGRDGRRVTGCQEHIDLSRRAAGEGMVLMRNEGQVLPFPKGQRIVLLGKASIDYVKGGGGSGDVTVAYSRNIYEGMKLKEAEGKVAIFHELMGFYQDYVKAEYAKGQIPGLVAEAEIPDELFDRARAFSDTAVVSISRFSGEGWDRTVPGVRREAIELDYETYPGEGWERRMAAKIFPEGDFYLTREERALLDRAKAAFSKVIVVMNVGGMIDSSWFGEEGIDAVLMSWQGGMEGGLATADVLCGDTNPSGHLTDTFAGKLTDYPSTENFHEDINFAEYTDDIYVGYRYFETIPGARDKVVYPFGFGLSYTDFEMKIVDLRLEKDDCEYDLECCLMEEDEIEQEANEGGGYKLVFHARVENTGKCAGKEVVQLYVEAPHEKMDKPARELIAFRKTRELAPGEVEEFDLMLPLAQMASFDDEGRIAESAWVLEAGAYRFYVGANVRDSREISKKLYIYEDSVVEQLSSKAYPIRLTKRLRADGHYDRVECNRTAHEVFSDADLPRQDPRKLESILPETRYVRSRCAFGQPENEYPTFLDVAEGRMSMEDFIAALPLENKFSMLGGQPNTGVANTFGIGNQREYGIPNVMTADGPAGLRINPECGVNTTAFPCATMMACTWNTELAEEVGCAAAREVKENNIGIWLTPAVNIHRSPLCGRNFEYYSEDPYLAGKIGAATVRGIQSEHIGTAVKHFAVNNKETNRKASDSIVSERALREVYLKQFEIIVKEAEPYCIMSSYNLINGAQASEKQDLLTGILRDEWGFQGLVMTDWWGMGEHYLELKAGNDVKMGCGYPKRLQEAYEKNLISDEEVDLAVRRVLEMILKFD